MTDIPADTPATKYTKTGKPVYCYGLALPKSTRFSGGEDEDLRYWYGECHVDAALVAENMGRYFLEVRVRLRDLGILRRRRSAT